MEKDAIDNDVSENMTKRDRDMEALLAAREAEAAEDVEDETDDIEDTEDTEDIDTDPEDEEIEEEPTTVFVTKDGTEIRVPISAVANLKIDGEDVASTVDQITRRYQKGAAGDKRLQEANELKRKLAEKEQALTRQEQEILDKAKAVNTDKDLSTDDRNSKLAELIEALVEADEERAAALLPQILPANNDVDSKVETLVERSIEQREQARKKAEYQKSLKESIAKFEEEYPELAKDEMLYQMVDQETIKVQRNNPDASPWDIISQSAQTVLEWKQKLAPGASSDRKIKKRATPTPRGGRALIGKDDPPPVTRADIIKEMRAARGQPA